MKALRNRVLSWLLAAVMALTPLYSAAPVFAAEVDNTTTLADGEYTVPEEDFSFTGGTGKARLTLDKVVVTNGQAFGEFTSSSANMTHVYYGGNTASDTEDPVYYDPDTDVMGEQVVAIDNKKVSFPVQLNEEMDIACRTVAMSEPHWVQYQILILLEEGSEEPTDQEIVDAFLAEIANNSWYVEMEPEDMSETDWAGVKPVVEAYDELTDAQKQLVPAETAARIEAFREAGKQYEEPVSEDIVLDVTIASGLMFTINSATVNASGELTAFMSSTSYDKAFIGRAADANDTEAIPHGEDGSFELGVLDEGYNAVAFHSAKKNVWYDRVFMLDTEAGTLVIDNPADYSAVDAALAKVPEDFTVYTDESLEVLLDAMDAVDREKTASEQDEVDAMAQAIEDAIAALELEEIETNEISLVPTNEELMFKVVNAYLEVTGSSGYLVFALNSTGYEDAIPGTYDEAMAAQVGASHDTWIHGAKADVEVDYWTDREIDEPPLQHTAEGIKSKLQFRVPIAEVPSEGIFKVPVVAVSKSKYTSAEKANPDNPDYSAAFTSRQFLINLDEGTVRVGNLKENLDITVTSSAADFQVEENGLVYMVGAPKANEFTCKTTILMKDNTYDMAFLGTAEAAAAEGAAVIPSDGGLFELPFYNSFDKHITMVENGVATAAFHVAEDAPYEEAGQWVERTFTFDFSNKTLVISGDELTLSQLPDGTYTASVIKTDVTTAASGMIMVTEATVVIKDGQATAIVTMKGKGADRFYVSDTATKDTIVAEAIAEEQKELSGQFGNLLGGLVMEGKTAYTFWPVPITLGESKVYAARSASHFSKQDLPAEEYYYVHDFQIDAADLVKVSDSTELPITAEQEAQRYLDQYFLDGKVVNAATAASIVGKNAVVTIPYYDVNGAKISSVIFKEAEDAKFVSGWFVDSKINNTTYFTSNNRKKIQYPEGNSAKLGGTVTFNPKGTYRDQGMEFTMTLKLYPADVASYYQYDGNGIHYYMDASNTTPAPVLAEQTFNITVEPVPEPRNVTVKAVDMVTKEAIENPTVTVLKADGTAVEATEGVYSLTVPDKYTVKVSAEGYVVPGTDNTEYVQEDYAPKKDGEVVTVELVKAEEARNTISFTFKDQMGEEVVNPTVSVYLWADKETVIPAEADGTYKLYRGTNYGYTVTAEGYEDTTHTLKPAGDKTEEVLVNKYLSEQKFTFRVYDSKTNEDIENVKLVVKYGPQGEEEANYVTAEPDEDGIYTIPINNQVIAYGSRYGYKDDSLNVWSLGFDPQKDCSFSLKPMERDFTVTVAGEEVTDIEWIEDGYDASYDYDGGYTVTSVVPLAVVTLPDCSAKTAEIKLNDYSKTYCIYYYTREADETGYSGYVGNGIGEYDAERYMYVASADTAYEVNVSDQNVLRIQTEFDEAWNSYNLYAIAFDYEEPHDLVKTEAKEEKCEEAGNIEYYTCSVCGRIFSDEEGKTEITEEDTVIPMLGHDWGEGVVTRKPTKDEPGVTTWTCTKCGMTRSEPIPYTASTKVTLEKTAEVAVGETLQLHAVVTPSDASDPTLTWTSSDTAVVTVDKNGKIKGKTYGKATITVATADGKKATCKVQTRFSDVNNPKKSYYEPVYWAVDNGITKCSKTFKPEDTVTRGEFVAFIWRLAGQPKSSAKISLTDVNSKTKFYDAIRWAVGEGIIKGYKDKTFKPDNGVTRGEAATMLWRYAGKPNPKTTKNPFSDLKPSTSDSYKAILWGNENGIMKGSGGQFLKDDSCTRGQIVTFLYRYNQKFG